MDSQKDPFNIPDDDEVEESGAADFVDRALEHHRRKQESLAKTFGGEKKGLRQEKDALAALFAGSADEEPVDPGDDLFAGERNQVRSKRNSLASIFGDEKEENNKNNSELRAIFGDAPKKKRR